MSEAEMHQLALTHAPLVRVFADDPPGDPDIWLSQCDLFTFNESGDSVNLGAATDYHRWPAEARNQITRPYQGDSGVGFALVPRQLFPKFLFGSQHGYLDGRSVPAGAVNAPCYYEYSPTTNGYRLSYWFFFPTSGVPANDFAELAPLFVEAQKEELDRSLFPPICCEIKRGRVDRFWGGVAKKSPFLGRLVDSSRYMGGLTNLPVLASLGALDQNTSKWFVQLDPTLQERIISNYVHEGDWEGLSVDFDQHGTPFRTLFWAHGAPLILDNEEVPLQMTEGIARRMVVVGRGSHASMPALPPTATGGRKSLERESFPDPSQPLWTTWHDLRPAQTQPWYGFGGSWGRPRMAPLGILGKRRIAGIDKDLWKESTGPLGPSAMKIASNDLMVVN